MDGEQQTQAPSVRVWRARGVAAAGLMLGVGIFTLSSGAVRNVGGDVLVVLVLVAALASFPVGRPWMRIVAVGVLSVGVEAFQGLGWVNAKSHWLFHLTVGSTYDPVDLVAYGAGLVVAAGFEWWWARPAQNMSGPTSR